MWALEAGRRPTHAAYMWAAWRQSPGLPTSINASDVHERRYHLSRWDLSYQSNHTLELRWSPLRNKASRLLNPRAPGGLSSAQWTSTHTQACAHTHMHAHSHIHEHTGMSTHSYTRVHTHTHIGTCTHTHAHMCTYMHVYAYVYMCSRTSTHTSTHAYTHIHEHTCEHTHTHTCTRHRGLSNTYDSLVRLTRFHSLPVHHISMSQEHIG